MGTTPLIGGGGGRRRQNHPGWSDSLSAKGVSSGRGISHTLTVGKVARRRGGAYAGLDGVLLLQKGVLETI